MGANHSRREALRQLASGVAALGLWNRSFAAPAATARSKIKIGQIGVGHPHASKLAVYRASPDYEVVGIVEPDPRLREQAGQQAVYRDLPWMTREQLLNLPGLQAVLVETEVRDLLDQAQACVLAGKHVHLDKPAGASFSQYRNILDLAEAQKLMVQMGYMYRYNPGVLLLQEFLRQGWLGEIFEVDAVMSKVVEAASREKLAEFHGGILFELGCHVLDLVVGVLGRPDGVVPFLQHSSSQQDTLMDNGLVVLGYPRTTATIRSSALEVEGFARRQLVVCGTEGTLQIQPLDNPSVTVSLSQPRGEYRKGVQQVQLPKFTRYVADAADMAQVIRGEKENSFPYLHDLTVQETLLLACGMPVE